MFQGVLHVKSILNWFWLFLEGLFCLKCVYNQNNILHYFMLVKHIIKITKQKAFYHTYRQTASEFSGLWADWIVGKKSMGHGPPAVSSGKLEISAKKRGQKGWGVQRGEKENLCGEVEQEEWTRERWVDWTRERWVDWTRERWVD